MAQFNPQMLTLARGSRGLTQTAFAKQMSWSQGKASKVEHGLIELSESELESVATALLYPTELFYQGDSARGFGTCCLYHRKRTTTPVRALNKLHDTINIRRIQLARLIRGIALPNEPNFPALDIDEYESPEQIAQLVRATWQLPRGPVRNLAEVIEAAGGLIVMMDLETPKIDAVSQRSPELPPIFFLDRSKPADRCRFTLAHELGHIVMHRTPTPNAESEADRFAAEFLMPAREIERDLLNLTIPKAAALKLQWRVAMQAIIRRARDTGKISQSKYQSLCVRISQLGYRKIEPNPIEPEPPKILRQIVEMYLNERKYSIAELSAATLCEEQEFRDAFLCSEQPAFRVVN